MFLLCYITLYLSLLYSWLTFKSLPIWRYRNIWHFLRACWWTYSRVFSCLFSSKSSNITVVQIYTPTTNAEEDEADSMKIEWRFYEDLQDHLELTPKRKKKCPFHHRGLECKSRKSRDTWNKRQTWPWNTKWNREKANRVLPREHIGNTKYPLQTTQEMTLHMNITRWSIPKSDWLYSMQSKIEKSIQSEKTRLGADCGSASAQLVTQSCPTLCDPMNHSMPSLPVHHQLPEFTQTHVHWVDDSIQPSHPLSSSSPPAFNLSQHQGLFQWVSSSYQVAKVLEFQLQHQSFQWPPRPDLL